MSDCNPKEFMRFEQYQYLCGERIHLVCDAAGEIYGTTSNKDDFEIDLEDEFEDESTKYEPDMQNATFLALLFLKTQKFNRKKLRDEDFKIIDDEPTTKHSVKSKDDEFEIIK